MMWYQRDSLPGVDGGGKEEGREKKKKKAEQLAPKKASLPASLSVV